MSLLTGSGVVDILIFLTTISVLVYKYFTWNFDYWKKRNVQFITPTPFYGNMETVVKFKKSLGKTLSDFYSEMKGDYFGIWVFRDPSLVIRSPELIKNILVKDFNVFHDRTVLNDEKADSISAHMLFFQKGKDWKTMRSKATPMFTSGKIKSMIGLMNEAAIDLLSHLHKNAGQSIDAKEVCAKLTTDIITSCAFGINAESFKHENAAFREAGRKLFEFKTINALRASSYFYAPIIVKIFRYSFFDPEVYNFFRKAFWETLNTRENSGVKRNDFIDIIIDIKKGKTIDGIKFEGDVAVAQAMNFFAAGFETTSSAITFTLYEMCMNPDIQTKLRQDILSVLQQSEGITYESLCSMKYLDKVLKETLRKYPVLPFLDRRCLQDYKIPGSDLIIEKGTPVYIPLYGLHYDPQYYPDPQRYDPERFSEENSKTRPTFAYFPFGEGPHNCIGERFGLITSKLVLVHVLTNFSVESNENTPFPIRYDTKGFILQSIDDMNMTFLPINGRK